MRPNFLLRCLTVCLLVLPAISPAGESPDQGTFQDVIEVATSYAKNGEFENALFFYTTLLKVTSGAKSTDHALAVCDDMAANVPRNEVGHFSQTFWNCPENLLVGWLGNVDAHRESAPKLLYPFTPVYGDRLKLTPAWVDVVFDVSPKGRIENIRIVDISDREWEERALAAIRRWKFSPATYEGKPVWAYDQKKRLTWE